MTASPLDTCATEVRQCRQILLWPLQLIPAAPLEYCRMPSRKLADFLERLSERR